MHVSFLNSEKYISKFEEPALPVKSCLCSLMATAEWPKLCCLTIRDVSYIASYHSQQQAHCSIPNRLVNNEAVSAIEIRIPNVNKTKSVWGSRRSSGSSASRVHEPYQHFLFSTSCSFPYSSCHKHSYHLKCLFVILKLASGTTNLPDIASPPV